MTKEMLFDYEALLQHIGGSSEFAMELLSESIRLLPGYIADILNAVKAGDMLQTKKTAHRLKGGMRTIQANALASAAETIEHAAASGDIIAVKETIPILETKAEETLTAIHERISI